MSRGLVFALAALGAIAHVQPTGAETYEVTWSTVDGGGVTFATGNGYEAGGTIAQPDAGTLSANGYAVTGGFWPMGPFPPGFPSDPRHQARKNRYISMDAGTNGPAEFALEVTLSSMKRCSGDPERACATQADCSNHGAGTCGEHADVGNVTKWVGDPFERDCFPQFDCDGQHFACLPNDPVFRTWSERTLHITDCEVVPVATYDVVVETRGGLRSHPLEIGTILKPFQWQYGDVVGPFDPITMRFTPPNRYVNITDISAYQFAFQGLPGAPHTTWVDLHGEACGAEVCEEPDIVCVVPQQILNVSDLSRIIWGFQGEKYTERLGHVSPGACP